jgi:uncharacterized membrane protein
MAGIGFELRKILKRDSYFSLVQAYLYAGVISSGPWLLSILGLQVIGILTLAVSASGEAVRHFHTTVTYAIVASMIVTSLLQQSFTRYAADRLYEHKGDTVAPNFFGALFLVTVVSGAVGVALLWWWFPGQTLFYRLLVLATFVVLGDIWIATIFLSGAREYKAIVGMFAIGYGTSVMAALALRDLGLEGLLLGFLIGQAILLMGMVGLALKQYPSARFLDWDFLHPKRAYPSLALIGFFYTVGIWADKLIFWYHPETSQAAIGPIRGSLIYDVPITLAWLTIIPGMAVFLVRIETDFVERCQAFYEGIVKGAPLAKIEAHRNEMVRSIRHALVEIMQVQGISVLAVFAAGSWMLSRLAVSDLYAPLLYIDVVAAALQVLFLGIMTMFFYLDKRKILLWLTGLFGVANLGGTWLSIRLGLPFYGYGLALSLLLGVTIGLFLLDRALRRLEYDTFMLQ